MGQKLVFILAISLLPLASVGEQAGLSLTWVEIPKDRFSRDVAHLLICSLQLTPES